MLMFCVCLWSMFFIAWSLSSRKNYSVLSIAMIGNVNP